MSLAISAVPNLEWVGRVETKVMTGVGGDHSRRWLGSEHLTDQLIFKVLSRSFL